MKSTVYVTIMGHEYPVDAQAEDEAYLNRLAQFVEARMKELKEESKIVDSYKLAVLTAMNIADELFRLQDGASSEQSPTKLNELLALVQKELE